MVWNLSVVSILGIIAALISGLLALYSARHRGKRMALQFTVQEVTLIAWSIAYAIQLGFGTLAEQLFWQRLTLGISGFIPTVFILFTFAYTMVEFGSLCRDTVEYRSISLVLGGSDERCEQILLDITIAVSPSTQTHHRPERVRVRLFRARV
jgi:predicted anti-sigma-YlaC factor YlaD